MESWTFFAGVLRGRTVIAFDGPGVGASETRSCRTRCRCCRISLHGSSMQSASKKADVVGYSHGGAVAQQIAVDHPTRVNRLVLLCDRVWGRRRSGSPPRCHPHLADAEPRHTVAATGSVGRALADRCHLDLVQHPRSRLHRRTHPGGLRRPRQGRPAGEQSATCGAHPRRPPHHDPGRTRSAKARPGADCGPTGGAVSRFGTSTTG